MYLLNELIYLYKRKENSSQKANEKETTECTRQKPDKQKMTAYMLNRPRKVASSDVSSKVDPSFAKPWSSSNELLTSFSSPVRDVAWLSAETVLFCRLLYFKRLTLLSRSDFAEMLGGSVELLFPIVGKLLLS